MEIYILVGDNGDGLGLEAISTHFDELMDEANYFIRSKIYKVNLEDYNYIDTTDLFDCTPCYQHDKLQ